MRGQRLKTMMHQVGSRLDHGYRVTSQVKLGSFQELLAGVSHQQSKVCQEGEREGREREMKRLEEGQRVGERERERGKRRGREKGRKGRERRQEKRKDRAEDLR